MRINCPVKHFPAFGTKSHIFHLNQLKMAGRKKIIVLLWRVLQSMYFDGAMKYIRMLNVGQKNL